MCVCVFSIIVCLVSLYQFTRVNTWKRSSKPALFIVSRPLDIAGADSNSSLSPSHCLCGMEWFNSAWTTSNCVILSKTLTDKHWIHFKFRMLIPVSSLSHFSLFVSVVATPYWARNLLLDVSWGYFPFFLYAQTWVKDKLLANKAALTSWMLGVLYWISWIHWQIIIIYACCISNFISNV